jgi:hypothetical protein
MDACEIDCAERLVTVGDLIAFGASPDAVGRLPVREVGPHGPCWRFREALTWLEFDAARACAS